VARVELAAQNYDQSCVLDGQPSVALSIYQLPGSNALEVARQVRTKMEELKARFPAGIDYAIVYDTTPFINESIREVFKTLRDAVILVALVVVVFLQNWRSAIIPLVAVPVAIIGTFAVMAGMGFSLNNLTLFGLVLAIGIVVDDAIVVVEAVNHHIENGLSPRDATILAMEQVSGPVIAVGLVLSAVFVPCAFISGMMGLFYRQFALTIAVSTVISAFNSLTLSPALSALLLRGHDQRRRSEVLPWLAYVLIGGLMGYLWLAPWLAETAALTDTASAWLAITVGGLAGALCAKPLNALFSRVFYGFNVGFDFSGRLYTRAVGVLLRISVVVVAAYAGLVGLTYWGFTHTPAGFIPAQDKGYLLLNVQLPDASSLERTERVMTQIESVARETRGVSHTVSIAGRSLLLDANAPNFGSMLIMLDDFHHRLEPELSSDAITASLGDRLNNEIENAVVNIFGAPPVEGLGTAGGFKIVVEDRADSGAAALQSVAERIVQAGNQTAGLERFFTSIRSDTPWLYIDIDRAQAKMMGVSIAEVFNALQVNLGSLYVNDFNRFGSTWQVVAQADVQYRQEVQDLKQLKVRNERGVMVPVAAFTQVRDESGPVLVARYNMYPSAVVYGDTDRGISSGQGMELTEHLVKAELGHGMRSEWTELALLQLQTGRTAALAFALAVVLAFLVLAAQYESWSLPLAVILVVPMCLLFSIAGIALARMDINIFTQVGLIVLVGLACKNAILIVEFAKTRRESGVPLHLATLEACQLRLRPIIMTSLAFILGVLPLMLSQGAGAEMRRTLGTAVFSGMLGVTLFGIFLTPVFYYVVQWLKERSSAQTA
jgi:multidrug efflux pump subunit AcrB